MPASDNQTETGHVDLILEQIDQLPTLSPIAVRVMTATESSSTDLREIARLLESDPALASKMLALCRRADRVTANAITTVNHAVVMLGLDAVRAAMLSVEIIDLLSGTEPAQDGEPRLDRREMWRYSIATACAAELLAEARPDMIADYRPEEAFLAGLLHDLGKLVLDRILPRAFGRVATICERQQVNIAPVERRVLGIEHHVAGKRLAEHWGLPHAIQDVIWLNGQPADSLPDLPHRGLIGAVTVAAALVKHLHIGWSGDFGAGPTFADVCQEYDCASEMVLALEPELERRLARRVEDLGLDKEVGSDLLLRAIAGANERLGRMALLLDRKANHCDRHAKALVAIKDFHAHAPERRSVTSVQANVIRSACAVFGEGFYAVMFQSRGGAPWSAIEMGPDGRPVSRWLVDQPIGAKELTHLIDPEGVGLDAAELLTWLAGEFRRPEPTNKELRLLPLMRGADGGVAAILVHDHPDLPALAGQEGVRALATTWGSAVAGAARHEGARRLGERVVEINRQLTDAQAKLVEGESLARLGELAAGAAHEMNNPLTVISGKAQLLARDLRRTEQRDAASAIVEAARQLSELISSLHLFADPPRPVRREVDLLGLLKRASEEAQKRAGGTHGVGVVHEGPVPNAWIDESQISQAVIELILNALQAGPRRNVEVRAQIDGLDDRLMITVADDGAGMSEHALKHASDPFFSELPAGRRSGLGLTRARRFVDLHGGELVLESKLGRGTTARIVLPEWRSSPARQAA